MKYDSQALSKLADKLLGSKDKFEKLKEIGNRQNYPHKVQKLKERLSEEFRFWMSKGPSNRLNNIEKDIKQLAGFLERNQFNQQEKAKIDQLVQKYPIQ
jgi:hypothetical protein